MNRLLLTCILLTIGSLACAQQANPATTPATRTVKRWNWMDRHNEKVEIVKNTPDTRVVFVGDSITHGWERFGAEVWEKYYAHRKAINLGFGGDQTQHLLWRLQNGEFHDISPKVVVMMIGTNNIHSMTTGQIVEGIKANCELILKKSPGTQILLLAVFPRNQPGEERRVKVDAINPHLAAYADGRRIHYLDIGHAFLEADGTLPKEVMPDQLHPHEYGYQLWADAMEPTLAGLLGDERVTSGLYVPKWESLARHEAEPEWLKDAKLGIYFHWGVYSVPAYDSEWYPRWMNFKGHNDYDHHTKTYGPPSEFGYHHFVKDFTAKHFDAAEWAELFRKAGARFAGPVAEHHDGFSMWDSDVTPWNAADKGPKQDILGELFAELEKRDMKTIATFHHARNLQRYKDTWEEETANMVQDGQFNRRAFRMSHYPYNPDLFTSSEDPELRLLYGNVPEEEWNENIWLGKLKEVVDKYQPDIVWFDSWLDRIPESYRKRFAAYYLNAAEDWNKHVAILRKQDDLPLEFSINDHEKSREPKALPELWMTDDTISTGSWCYTENLEIKPLNKVIHAVVDTVSKNGVVLLNISPKADGTIPEDQKQVLLGLGKWMDANGDAIYGTRPWINAAEGPTAEPEGGFSSHREFLKLEYSARDIRYTASRDGKTVYAILLGIPDAGSSINMETFAREGIQPDKVTLISGKKLNWEMTSSALVVKAPKVKDKDALVIKISL